MTIFYSASTNGFYLTDVADYPELPSDKTEITEALWRELLDGQAAGKIITADESGLPYLSEPVRDFVLEADNCRDALLATATAAIAPLQDAVELDIATETEAALYSDWRKYRVQLMRVDTSAAPDIEWPIPPVEQAS
ncbi:tail fiber assembly protein [Escherichia coli]|nr:tail fiber assembly protein [Escherichia coli]